MEFVPSKIPDVLLLRPKVYDDGRGFFMETYRSSEFTQAGISAQFVQDNHSCSFQGVLRGLHYQIRFAQGKLIRVVVGEVFDVAVDLRRHSKTFGHWVAYNLSSNNKYQMWIPPGFAHGFYVLSERAELVYKSTEYWAPQWERTVLWNDPDIGIEWPINKHQAPTLSEKDRYAARLKDLEPDDLFA